ncbi:hypothetical protein AAE02nite_10200 [Adhaeribacter aerolatus]|uniref:site-specific DNA-methyltransferase (adenine-specific) n=2 Tax=Adhaeribacter aerolatus TaxID=670289 RepID=A0A512AUG4_9BACT|nr:hypothetical protein AAE02nite_10200 [Adhaeribacter aerolatus]
MDAEQRSLRNRLRHKARLLGDAVLDKGEHQIGHLAYELAYEYWHQMLFAKFLEANGLLMHTSGVAVSMEDCEELAREEGYADKWAAAAGYASRMLPAIFRPDDPLMQVSFATEDRLKLEALLDSLEEEHFTADDSLGWVYQFWQSEAKAKINASGDKIDGEKLPAVTQLFTEPYMVHFLIDNTLGAWWLSRNPGITPPVKFEYLRFSEDGTPAAGKFEDWPDKTAEVTSLDPCMGSGHFVASLFPVFAKLRMHEEGLSKEEATDKVIAENLNGLELDPRCTQIAAFNLALTAWKFCGQYKELPEMHLACSGIAPKGKQEDWVKLVGKVDRLEDKARMENGIKALYNHFQLAPELGSLLDPSTIKADAFTASFEELKPVLQKALSGEIDKDQVERGVVAAGIAKAGHLLSLKYTLVITNPPYLGERKQAGKIRSYAKANFPLGRPDLATIFLTRGEHLVGDRNTQALVIPQNWLYQSSYLKLREDLLKRGRNSFLCQLGSNAFVDPIGADVVLLILNSNNKMFYGLDVTDEPGVKQKEEYIKKGQLILLDSNLIYSTSDSRIVISERNLELPFLENYADCLAGIQNGDSPKFTRFFWEIKNRKNKWWFMQGTSNTTCNYSGLRLLIDYDMEHGHLRETKEVRRNQLHDSDQRGNKAWNKDAVAISLLGDLKSTIYKGWLLDQSAAVILPKDNRDILPILAFIQSVNFNVEVRKIDKKRNVTNATLGKVPFDIEHWQKVAAEKYPNGLPKPYSDDATQWLFHGHPVKAETPLQVATARMLGYRWPAESDKEMELANEARELIATIKIFDELTDEDGILCIPSVNGEMPAADRLREYLQAVYGSDYTTHTIEELLQKEGSKKASLDEWLREEFFEQHCKLFQNRPFIWHIWDGRKDGFSALVNYHKLTKENLQKLIYTYLGDWIRHCEQKRKNGESGADGLLLAANALKEKLELIQEGEAPYDIFVRWKSLEQQPIGWEPDLNDGVRLNIRPFIQANVLRKRVSVNWGVDRGRNPTGSYWGEVRDNDKHLSLEEKRTAQANLVGYKVSVISE